MASQKIDVTKINALAELERIGWAYDLAGDEAKVRCPCHDDAVPSASINLEKNLWRCYTAGCGAHGDFISFLAYALKTNRVVVYEDLCSRYDELRVEAALNPKLVEQYHEALWDAKPMLRELRKRGVTDAMIRSAKLGYSRGRITIPVYSGGFVVNIRRYMPGAPGPDKMRNTRGYSELRLYQEDQAEQYERVVVCGGELKALVTKHLLNPHGWGAVSGTGGEDNWSPTLTAKLVGKHIVVMYDIDPEGVAGAAKLAARLAAHVGSVRVAALPLDPEKYPHGDVNDFVGSEKATDRELLSVVESAPPWEPPEAPTRVLDQSSAELVTLQRSTDATMCGRRIEVKAVVSAIDAAPYLVPKAVRASCTRDQEFCIDCAIYAHKPDNDGFVELTVSAQSPSILDLVDSPTSRHRATLMDSLGVPQGCKVVEFSPREYYNVHDTRLTPQLDIGARHESHVTRSAYIVQTDVDSNTPYIMTGRLWPHPRTQQATLLISDAKLAEDSLGQFKPSDEDLEELTLFCPREWTRDGIHDKLDDLYSDIESNVTRIYRRRLMHLMIDLVYHTPLFIKFDERVEKGWAELLIVGDTAQGKSETTTRMMRHYGLGERVECKNASVAGLLGGLQQMGNNRWFVTWGVIPTHDKRLVILEEVKGASTEVIARLTDMRSTGVAEIPKIEKSRAHARTRLIMVSNPRSDRPLAAYNFGVEAVKELIGGLEDIRRFDAVLVVAEGQVGASEINLLMRSRPVVQHKYTSELCRRLVLYAWTRGHEQVVFEDGAEDEVLAQAVRMCDKYTEAIPIVDRGSMRMKLARLSAGLAMRTFSHARDDARVAVVRRAHVEYVSSVLDEAYSDPACGYLGFSEAVIAATVMSERDANVVLDCVVHEVPFPGDFVAKMLATDEVTMADICDWCGWSREKAVKLLSLLVRKNALTRRDRAYRKTPGFIDLLRRAKTRVEDRPSFMEETRDEF